MLAYLGEPSYVIYVPMSKCDSVDLFDLQAKLFELRIEDIFQPG